MSNEKAAQIQASRVKSTIMPALINTPRRAPGVLASSEAARGTANRQTGWMAIESMVHHWWISSINLAIDTDADGHNVLRHFGDRFPMLKVWLNQSLRLTTGIFSGKYVIRANYRWHDPIANQDYTGVTAQILRG